MELLGKGILGFVVIAALAIFGVVIVAALLARVVDRFVKKRSLLEMRPPVTGSITPVTEDVELLPKRLQQLGPASEPYVRAIYSSVRRYKDPFHTCFSEDYYFCAVHSKRYDLKISLNRIRKGAHLISVKLEGGNKQIFRVKRTEWTDRVFKKSTDEFKFSNYPKYDSEIKKEELSTMLKPLIFFEEIAATPGELTAKRMLDSNTTLADWPQVLGAFIRLGRFLIDVGLRKEILADPDVLCPYCRGEFGVKDDTVSCGLCKTRHHNECWEEVGRCSVFGCGSKSQIVITLS